jgi:hypothetical protein
MTIRFKNLTASTVFMQKRLDSAPVAWSAGSIDGVDDEVAHLYRQHPTVFEELGGNASTSSDVPTAAETAGVTKAESPLGLNSTVLTFTGVSVTMTDAAAAGSHGSLEVLNFPAGLIVVAGVTSDLAIARVGTAITTTAAVVGSIGSVTVGTDNATLTSTEADLLPSTAASLTAGAGNCDGQSTAVTVLDGTATAAKAFLNLAIPDAGSTGNDALTVTGTVTILWGVAGDN